MRHAATAAGNSASPIRNNVSFTAEYSQAQFASHYRTKADAPSDQEQGLKRVEIGKRRNAVTAKGA